MEDIGSRNVESLLCVTKLFSCCKASHANSSTPLGNWYFPNGTTVPNKSNQASGMQWDFYRTRGRMVVRMHRRRGGVDGIYRCEIPYSGKFSLGANFRDFRGRTCFRENKNREKMKNDDVIT